MVEQIHQRFQGSCMMLMRQTGDGVAFLGSCFLVHSDGYLLTTSRGAPEDADLVVVPTSTEEIFPRMTRDQVAPLPVEVVSRDTAHDTALLKIVPELEIRIPDGVLSDGERTPQGATVMALGVPFGYYGVHSVLATHALLAGRLQTSDGTRLLIIDRRVQYGDAGGPLISASDATVIGILGNIFEPTHFTGVEPPQGIALHTNLSYAVSIEYGAAMLAALV